MIEWVTLENFQKHQNRTFRFGPVTTLVGPTGSGKSSLVRALYWLFFNKPDGDQFVRHGSKLCTVTASIDGHVLSRSRGKGVNSYALDGVEYKALGRGSVPVAVREFLRADPVNFARQAEPYFWFSGTQGEVSRSLNELVDLSLIDDSLAFAAKSISDAKQRRQDAQDRVRMHQEAIRSLEWTDRTGIALDALESLLEALATVRQKRVRLEGVLGEIRARSRSAGVVPDLGRVGVVVGMLESARGRRAGLGRVLGSIAGHESAMGEESEALREVEQKLEGMTVCPTCGR